MIVQADVVGLEVLCAAFLSQDAVLYEELNRGVDIHSANQAAFNLPEGPPGRLVAKVFKFRLIYGGSEYGFVQDSDFTHVSKSKKYWRAVIDKYYDKYKGIAAWHQKIVQEVATTSKLVMPTGREYEWDLMKHGSFKIPEPQVKNYPVQGFGADIMSIARVSFARRFLSAGIHGKLINTVHDSIVVDVSDNDVRKVVDIFNNVFADLAANISRIFNIPFDLEVRCEVLVGKNQGDLYEIA
jgi:DNA polymerase I-like protein with 3'-5' exonuclease and polymerase domains